MSFARLPGLPDGPTPCDHSHPPPINSLPSFVDLISPPMTRDPFHDLLAPLVSTTRRPIESFYPFTHHDGSTERLPQPVSFARLPGLPDGPTLCDHSYRSLTSRDHSFLLLLLVFLSSLIPSPLPFLSSLIPSSPRRAHPSDYCRGSRRRHCVLVIIMPANAVVAFIGALVGPFGGR